MNAFDKINPETAELMEGAVQVEVPAAPVTPTAPKDPNLTEGVEIIKAEIIYGSCHYLLRASNRDGSHATDQPVSTPVIEAFGADAQNGSRGYFYARYSGPGRGYSSDAAFTDLKRAPDQNW